MSVFVGKSVILKKRMSKAVKPRRKNLIVNMNIMQVTPVPEPQQTNSIGNSNQDSDGNGTDLFLHIGQYHYLRTDNGDVDHEFNV